MTAREILTKWAFKVDDKALTHLDKSIDGIKNRIDALIATKIARGLFSLGENFSKMGEEIQMGAAAAGIATDQFQKLAYAAKLNNLEQGEMNQGLRVLARQLYSARQGGKEAMDSFKRVGFSPEQVRGFHNTQEALFALSDRFSQIQDPIKKSALAQELLGRGGTRMVGFLSKGSKAIQDYGKEAKKLGIILSSGQWESLAKLENTLQKLWAVLRAISETVAATVSPAIVYFVEQFLKLVAANRSLAESNTIGFLKQMAYGFGFVFGLVEGLGIKLFQIAKFFGAENNMGKFIADAILLATAIWGIGKALAFIRTVLGVILLFTTPINLMFVAIAAAVSGLILLFHDIDALMKGNNTWTGMAFQKIGSVLGFGGQAPPAGVVSNNTQGNNFSISAPMNFTIPEGTPPGEVNKSVKEGVAEHFERILRQTNRTTAPTGFY